VGQSANAPIITLRGIGTENASLTGEAGVAFHVDGVYLARPSAARVAFFDLETLDVKRGPQGLLGGKNTTSGSINLVSKKPIDEYEVSGDVLFGNYDRVRMRGAINIPLGERVASRLALYHEDRDGFLDNVNLSDSHDPFDADDFGLRGHLKLEPSDTFEVLLSYNYFKQGGVGPQADAVPLDREVYCGRDTVMYASAACFNAKFAPVAEFYSLVPERTVTGTLRDGTSFSEVQKALFATPAYSYFPDFHKLDPASEDGDPRSIYLDVPSAQDNRYWGWTTTFDWDAPVLPLLGESHVKLLGGFQNVSNDFKQDFDTTDVPLFAYALDDSSDQYSGELQWSGMLAERLDWQVSLFHSHEQAERGVQAPSISGLLPGQDPFAQQTGSASLQTTDNKSYGAALHGVYHLTDDLRFSLGGRFIKDRKSTQLLRRTFSAQQFGQFRGCTGDLGHGADQGRDIPGRDNEACSKIERHTIWGAGIDWRPFGADHLLYAKIDRGAKSGGFHAGNVGEFGPERIWAYALGTKSEFFDQRLRVNLEGFVYAYDSLQLVILDGLASRTENTDARMWGWDLEAQASPVDGLELSAVLSFLDTETIDYLSLDTADANEFQKRRLDARELAESNAAEGHGGLGFADLVQCYGDRFPTGQSPLVRCGDVTPHGGLDDFSGNELSRSPRLKYMLSGDYEIPLGRFGSLTPRVQYTWQDETYFRVFNRDFDRQEDYHLTDAKLTWTSPEERWSVETFVQNIEDEAPKQNILVAPRQIGAPPLAWYGPPRFYGVQVGFRY
jgi:iron complex outermembrane receptor protein